MGYPRSVEKSATVDTTLFVQSALFRKRLACIDFRGFPRSRWSMEKAVGLGGELRGTRRIPVKTRSIPGSDPSASTQPAFPPDSEADRRPRPVAIFEETVAWPLDFPS